MKQFYSLYLFPIVLISFISCNKEEIKAPVPGYLTINDIVAIGKDPERKVLSDAIVDAWVYQDDQLLGAFELPTTIPIQKTGKLNLRVRAGILNNGLSNDRARYAFYDFFELDTIISEEEEMTIKPVVQYYENTILDSPWSGEDFESGINFDHDQNITDVLLQRETDSEKVFEGAASGVAALSENDEIFEAYTPEIIDIPRGTAAVYLELNYKTTHDFTVSVYTNNRTGQYAVVNFKASTIWKKGYVEFTPVFSTLFSASNYNIAIGFKKPIGEKGTLYLDNVKLLHY